MTRKDHRIIFTALGFLGVLLRNDVPEDQWTLRATSIARLIETFCAAEVPDAFDGEYMQYSTTSFSIEKILERYIAELRQEGSSNASFDRKTLLAMYELLLAQKTRYEQKEFYASAHDDMIANRVLQLASEKIDREAV